MTKSPEFLYKYMPDKQYVIEAIRNKTLCWTRIDGFNDPLEFRFNIKRCSDRSTFIEFIYHTILYDLHRDIPIMVGIYEDRSLLGFIKKHKENKITKDKLQHEIRKYLDAVNITGILSEKAHIDVVNKTLNELRTLYVCLCLSENKKVH